MEETPTKFIGGGVHARSIDESLALATIPVQESNVSPDEPKYSTVKQGD